jgi:hypothetical protein
MPLIYHLPPGISSSMRMTGGSTANTGERQDGRIGAYSAPLGSCGLTASMRFFRGKQESGKQLHSVTTTVAWPLQPYKNRNCPQTLQLPMHFQFYLRYQRQFLSASIASVSRIFEEQCSSWRVSFLRTRSKLNSVAVPIVHRIVH